jgi:hypothetical protein
VGDPDEDNDQDIALLQSPRDVQHLGQRLTGVAGGGHGSAAAQATGASAGAQGDPAALVGAARHVAGDDQKPIDETWHSDIDKPTDQRDTAAAVMGVSVNGEGDLAAFVSNVAFTAVFVAGLLGVFCLLRLRYEPMYSHNRAMPNRVTRLGWIFGWVSDSLWASDDEIQDAAGLDALMLVKFFNLCAKICAVLVVSNFLIMGTLHRAFGKGESDTLSQIGFGHVQQGSWLTYAHAVLVWAVVVVVEKIALSAHHDFIERKRYKWLSNMAVPQSTTVMVECIPDKYRSDTKLLGLFQQLFGKENVQMAHMVLNTDDLLADVAQKEDIEFKLHSAEFEWKKYDNDPAQKPQFRDFSLSGGGKLTDTIDYYTEQKENVIQAITTKRTQLLEGAKDSSPEVSPIFSTSGFVTFTSRHFQELALQVCYTEDADEFVVGLPPDPGDIIYSDLQTDPTKVYGKELLGYALVFGVYLVFMPFVVGISWLTSIPQLEKRYPSLQQTLADWPPGLVAFMSSMSAVLGLKLFMCFLPTILMIIFRNFFCLRAGAWAQAKLQIYYFWFLVVFEILATTVGTSLLGTLTQLLEQPTTVLQLLGNSLPQATHFYLNYMVVNWGTTAMDATRYVYIAKFITYKSFMEEERARELSEPEDQDYYGQGGRSARAAEYIVMALVFSSLAPLICVLALINFGLCRLVYGYLMVWAETRKPDLGGVFWVSNLRHLQWGLLLYVLTMSGCLAMRADTVCLPSGICLNIPSITCLASVTVVYYFNKKFESLLWKKLPMLYKAEDRKETSLPLSYRQPELQESEAPAKE